MCVLNSTEKYLGRSNFCCQLSYSGVVILKNGRTLVDMNITIATKRCSMSCLPVSSLVNLLQVQSPHLSCLCGFQSLLFKNCQFIGSNDTTGSNDVLICNNETKLVLNAGNWTFINMIEFGRHCCKSGAMASKQTETVYRDGYCMCKDKLKTKVKTLNIKYSWLLEGVIGWIVALYLCRGIGIENIFLTLTILGLGSVWRVRY